MNKLSFRNSTSNHTPTLDSKLAISWNEGKNYCLLGIFIDKNALTFHTPY